MALHYAFISGRLDGILPFETLAHMHMDSWTGGPDERTPSLFIFLLASEFGPAAGTGIGNKAPPYQKAKVEWEQ